MPDPILVSPPIDSRDARRRVLADIKKLRDDASDLLSLLASDTSELAVATRERVQGLVDRLREVGETVKAEGKISAEAVDEQVKAHPYTAAAVTFGVGLLVGAILNR